MMNSNSCIFVAIVGSTYDFGVKILGVYSEKEKAIARCISERTYTRSEWLPTENFSKWHNGAGLYVEVQEHLIK